jgi:hypothetical protein
VLESSTFHLGPLTSPQTDFAKMGRFGVRVLATVLLCGGSWVAGQDLGSGSASGGEHGTLSVSVCVCVCGVTRVRGGVCWKVHLQETITEGEKGSPEYAC